MLSQLCPVKIYHGQWASGSMEKKNPDSSELTRYDRSSDTRSRIHRVYTDINIANNFFQLITYWYVLLIIGEDLRFFNNSFM